MEEISNKDLLGEIAILNGKLNILVSLFERVETLVISCAGLSVKSRRKFINRAKDDFKDIREKIGEFENHSRKMWQEGNADGEL